MKNKEIIKKRKDFLTGELRHVRNKDMRSILTTERDTLEWVLGDDDLE